MSQPTEADRETLVEERRMQGCCIDCARKYGDEYGFPDMLVADDVWRQISPTGDEGGLLCPCCMLRRMAVLGLSNVHASFQSGPCYLHAESAQALADARETGRKDGTEWLMREQKKALADEREEGARDPDGESEAANRAWQMKVRQDR